jgi:hypothetical protein
MGGMVDEMQHIGRLLVISGVAIAAIGVLIIFSGKLPWLGRLPGDIVFHRKNFTFYFPLATSILISLVLTLLFWIFGRR